MALPLMPSPELGQPMPEPEVVTWSTGWDNSALSGCQRAMCVGAQPVPATIPSFSRPERNQDVPRGSVQGLQRGVYDNSNNAAGPGFHGEVRWRIPGTLQVCDETGRSQWTYDEELPDGTLIQTCGGNRGARWVPDVASVPHVVKNGRIRGRYTLNSANHGVAGDGRWLDPVKCRLYYSAIDSVSSNTHMVQQSNGTWRGVGGLIWEAV